MVATTTVRVTRKTHAMLNSLADEAGQTTQSLLDQLVEEERRRRILDAANADFAAMRADPDAWAEELAERQLWDQTLADGMDDEA
ncbi:MAG: toxin-antitoxin system protein [Thermomicrobiales bacterium]